MKLWKQRYSYATFCGLLLFSTTVACNDSQFSGASGSTRQSNKITEPKGPAEDNLTAKPKNSNDTGNKPRAHQAKTPMGTPDDEVDVEEDPVDSEADTGNAGGLINQDEATCLLKKGNQFRLVIIFDNSLSTGKTDPGNIRVTAAMQVIDQFSDFVAANPGTSARVVSMDFAGHAVVGANGWVDLAANNRQAIENDIMVATRSPRLGTNFSPPLSMAVQLLAQDGATASDERQRNYVIILSDGQAVGFDNFGLAQITDTLANTHGAAVYSILLDRERFDSRQLMQSIAVPSVGVVNPDHVGKYIHAQDAGAIDRAFRDFFKDVSTCK